MKKKYLIVFGFISFLIVGTIIGFLILSYGYGGGNKVKPVSNISKIKTLEKKLKNETQYDGTYIDMPRNYEIENCDKKKMQQEIYLGINNDSLKREKDLEKYILSVNNRIQKIFPYDKKCYDSIIINASYYDNEQRIIMKKHYSYLIE